jgi:hypothetical protein
LVIAVVTLLFFIMVDCYFGKYSVEYKYTLIIFIPILITIILLFNILKEKFLYVWLVFLAIIYLNADIQKYHCMYKLKEYKSLGFYLEKSEKSGQPVFVFRNISADNLAIYYKGVNKVLPVPEAFSYEKTFGPLQWKIGDEELNKLNNELKGLPVFYFVIDDTALEGYANSKKVLMNFLSSGFNTEEIKPFKDNLTLYKFSSKAEMSH